LLDIPAEGKTRRVDAGQRRVFEAKDETSLIGVLEGPLMRVGAEQYLLSIRKRRRKQSSNV